MNHWLIKTEPNTYSWDDFVKLGRDHWNGVRNYAARKHMMEMKVDDLALFYHSVNDKSVVGVAKVVKEHYPDPTTSDDRWVVVDFEPAFQLDNHITLSQIKNDERLRNMVLVHNSRLSVQPVTKAEFDVIVSLGKK